MKSPSPASQGGSPIAVGYVPPDWNHTTEGPPLEAMTRRLAECPPDFLAEPMAQDGHGEVAVAAVVSDLLCDLGGAPLTRAEAGFLAFPGGPADDPGRNHLRTILVTTWLLHDEWFRARPAVAPAARALLRGGLEELASLVPADRLVVNGERREELARLAMRALALRPDGESVRVAQDRFDTISSPARARVVREARTAEERARRVREELARKAREEAAASYGSE